MRCSVAVGLLVVGLLGARSESAAAQSCYYLTYGCEGGAQNHFLSEGGAAIGNPFHSDCRWCSNEGAGPCHDSCGHGLLPSLTKSALASALAAAERGDARTVLSLSTILGDRVRFHAQRRALQIMSCSDESVIASLPLTTPALLAAAGRFAQVQPVDLALWEP